ncbi:hypothetical protein [Falsirhodobacter halotolerans]|uniref:hypothetical protein n=1 Tax=Falsirhodobacter halotolerans TaxID=1146892 RepID=UPI001FD3B90B|nr:hypothetical protein [Falsirhodobacter halotolerans]MCJ8139901.1 hypothetical protein [Falsirhodobacter halotolerans]
MIVQTLKQVGLAFLGSARSGSSATASPFFEVMLISGGTGACPIGAVPLTITTTRPMEVAGELMRDRDPRYWDVEIRPVDGRRH